MRERGTSSLQAWAIILMVIAVLVVIYPLSFGPMFWLCSDPKGQVGHDFKSKAFLVVYGPIISVMQNGPEPWKELVHSYFSWWQK